MRDTLVVQVLEGMGQQGMNNFWLPCTRSVEAWAARNEYDYCLHTQGLPDIDYYSILNLWEWRPNVFEHVYYSFIRLHLINRPEYRRVIFIDADCYCWGDPQINNAWFATATHNTRTRNNMLRPANGIIWGTEGINNLYNWYHSIIYDKNYEDTWIKHYMYCKWYKYAYNDQDFITTWINEHKLKIHNIGLYEDATIHVRVEHPFDRISYNSFIHFIDTNKQKSYNYFIKKIASASRNDG